MRLLLSLLLLVSAPAFAEKSCSEELGGTLARVGFEIPKGAGRRVDFPIDKTAAELRGEVTPEEKQKIANDRNVWDRLRLADSKVKPTEKDSVLYPASGVDFGTPINTIPGAGLYIGVDIENTFTNAQVLEWAGNSKFDATKLFRETKYVSTIPYMITGDAGKGPEFAKSHLRNLACVLPDNAKVESLSFILDDKPLRRPGRADPTPELVGPHVMVTWCLNGVRQSSLLISAPMLAPAQGKGVWWYEQIDKLKPSYGVMKRPQGFSFDEVFEQMCRWVVRKGGYIVSEGNREDNTKDAVVAACLQQASYKRHELTNKQAGREDRKDGRGPGIFGFDDTAVVVEVFGKKGEAPKGAGPTKPAHK